MTTKEKQNALVRVGLWHGTTWESHEVSTYQEAMALISSRHRNKHDPSFEEIATGKPLYDDGNGLRDVYDDVYVV